MGIWVWESELDIIGYEGWSGLVNKIEWSCTMCKCSIAHHTSQSEGKRDLVTVRSSCSGDSIWSRPIRFEIAWQRFCWRLVHILLVPRCLRLPVTFYVIIAFQQNNLLYARWPPDPLYREIEAKGASKTNVITYRKDSGFVLIKINFYSERYIATAWSCDFIGVYWSL